MSERQFASWEQAVLWLRGQPDRRDLVRDCYFDDPLVGAATRYWNSEEWSSIRPMLLDAKGASALDVGAGRGVASFALAKEGFVVTALEPNGSALVGAEAIRTLARDTGMPISVIQDFSERLPFPDAEFDLVFGRAVLHHVHDLASTCREFFRVLKPSGRFIAVREHVISKPEDLSAFLDSHPLHHLYGGENAYVLEQYTKAIRSAGFNLRLVLSPFESLINLAPHNDLSIQRELAQRLGRPVPGLSALIASLLRAPGAWVVARRMLALLDHRPGRLYSFVAIRP